MESESIIELGRCGYSNCKWRVKASKLCRLRQHPALHRSAAPRKLSGRKMGKMMFLPDVPAAASTGPRASPPAATYESSDAPMPYESSRTEDVSAAAVRAPTFNSNRRRLWHHLFVDRFSRLSPEFFIQYIGQFAEAQQPLPNGTSRSANILFILTDDTKKTNACTNMQSWLVRND